MNRVFTDSERMDWLVSQDVEVRIPLRYGSRHLFYAESIEDEGEPHRTSLREQIDEEIRKL